MEGRQYKREDRAKTRGAGLITKEEKQHVQNQPPPLIRSEDDTL